MVPNPRVEPRSPTLQANSLPAEPQGKPKNTGVGSLSLFQRIFPTQGLNQGLLHCRWILYQLSYQGSPAIEELPPLKWVKYTELLELGRQETPVSKFSQHFQESGEKRLCFSRKVVISNRDMWMDMSVPATEEKEGLCAGNFQAVREKAWPSGAWGMEPRKGRLTIQLHEDVDS